MLLVIEMSEKYSVSRVRGVCELIEASEVCRVQARARTKCMFTIHTAYM